MFFLPRVSNGLDFGKAGKHWADKEEIKEDKRNIPSKRIETTSAREFE